MRHYRGRDWRVYGGIAGHARRWRKGNGGHHPDGERTSEVLNAKWSEFDLDGKLWTIPKERMKSLKEHRVPLTDAVMAVLTAVKAESNGGEYVFSGRKVGTPLTNMACLQTLRRMGRGDLTVHGL